MIFKNLWRRATRSLLTILGIAIGVAAVVALGAMAEGMIRNYGTAVGLNNDLLVTQANAIDAALQQPGRGDGAAPARQSPGVENVDPGVYTWIATEEMPFFLLFGYEPGSAAAQHYRIVEGKPVTGPKQIALGRRAAESLKKTVDDTVRLYGVPYRIVGIYETGQGMEESGGLVTLADGQEIAQKPRKVSLFQVGVGRVGRHRAGDAAHRATDKTLTVSKASEYDATEQWTGYMQGFAWGIAAIAILVGGLGMMNAMVMSVLERTREIGTLRALGWRRGRVVGLILGEALVLSVLGGADRHRHRRGADGAGRRVSPGVGAFLEGVYSPSLFAQGLVTAVCPGAGRRRLPGLVGGEPAAGGGAALRGRQCRGRKGKAGSAWADLPVRAAAPQPLAAAHAHHHLGDGHRHRRGDPGDAGRHDAGAYRGAQQTGRQRQHGQHHPDAAQGGRLSLSTLDERMVSQIQAMPGVKSVSPMLLGFVMTPEMPMFMLGGLDPNSAAMAHYKLVEGRAVARPNEILIGKMAADNYKLGLGDVLTLYDNRYKVVGIYETGVAYEDGGGMLALREAQRLLGPPALGQLHLRGREQAVRGGSVRAALERRFPEAQVSLSSELRPGQRHDGADGRHDRRQSGCWR